MTNEPVGQPSGDPDVQQASKEATERLMRLQVWLNGLLAGGPTLAEAVKPWRKGLSIYRVAAPSLAEDQDQVVHDDARVIEEALMAAIGRLRVRREQSGYAPPDLHPEEQRRRLAEVVEKIEADRQTGDEFTPMHIVLAARYIEGVITPEDYRSRS